MIIAIPIKVQPSTDISIDADIDINTDFIGETVEKSLEHDDISEKSFDLLDVFDEETITMIEQMSSEDFGEFFSSIAQIIEDMSGLKIPTGTTIDYMSDEEFQKFLDTIS